MRVCHVWDRFWPLEIGGVERYILWLSHYLAKNRKIDFSLITGRTKILLVTRNILKHEDAGFLKVSRLGPRPVDIVSGAFVYLFGSMPKLVEEMKLASLCHEAAKSQAAKTADIFHIHGIWADLEFIRLGMYLSRRFHKPLVVTLHGVVGDPKQGGMPLESPKIRDILHNYTDGIITYSKDVLSVLERIGVGRKTYFMPNFVDTKKFLKPNSAKNNARDPTIIYVGRLENVQTPEVVINAFKKVHEKFSNAKLLVVGYGTRADEVKRLVHDLNLDGNVSLLGKQTDVRKFLWNSDIFVATNFSYIASLEAWSAGLPVIAPDFGILKEVVAHEFNGLLVPEHDADSYAAAIIRLIEDEPLRKKLALNGFQTVRNYDADNVLAKIGDVYQSIISSEANSR